MKLLHIDSSITGDNSVSRELSGRIVERLVAANPDIEVVRRDLATEPLPHLTLERLASAEGAEVLEEFLGADILVIGAPMYNFGLPTQLKAWFDHILVKGKTFGYGPEGPLGLAGDKRVIVAHARGGFYGADSPMADWDHGERHLRTLLRFIGVTEPTVFIAEGLAVSPEQRQAGVTAATAHIDALAA